MLVRGIQWVEERGFPSNHPMPYPIIIIIIITSTSIISHLLTTFSSHSHLHPPSCHPRPHLPHYPSIYILIRPTLTSTIPIYLRHPHPIIHVHIPLPDLLIFISLRPAGSMNPPLSCPGSMTATAARACPAGARALVVVVAALLLLLLPLRL